MALADIVMVDTSIIGVIAAGGAGSMVDICYDKYVGLRDSITGGAAAGASYDGNAFDYSTEGGGSNIFVLSD